MPAPKHPVLLIVIDGWGEAAEGPHNAIRLSKPQNMERLAQEYPSTLLEASGPHVGLPEGQMGNSEVGHLNIGAGRIVDQDFVRINKAVRAKTLRGHPSIRSLLTHCKETGAALHLMGLLGPGGVHSHEDHLIGALEAAKAMGLSQVYIHHFLDGRDTPPKSALDYAKRVDDRIRQVGVGRVVTVVGRYYAMDRDKRWERTERAYKLLTSLEGFKARDAAHAVQMAYERGETDEFVQPTILNAARGLKKGDAVWCYNFRPDRMRQIVRALMDPQFLEFKTQPLDLELLTMTMYDASFAKFRVKVGFPPLLPSDTWGEWYAKKGLKQLRIAETEKYAHVTYFFSGGRESAYPGEDRILIPSAKVATYDLQPAMSARETTDALLKRLAETRYDLVVLNFANPDMVGHTGMLEPTIEACRVTDECIGRIHEFCKKNGYVLVVTADHGNAEAMQDAEGRPQTAHTSNKVPLIVAFDAFKGRRLKPGGLSSVAPTLLQLVGMERPDAMTAPSLLDLAAPPMAKS